MLADMLAFAIWGKVINRPRRGAARPWSLITNIGPDTALFHALTQPLVAPRAIQNPDRGIIRVQQIARHDVRFDPFNNGLKDLHRPTAPIHQRTVRNVSAQAGEDFVLSVKRKVIVKFRDQHMRQ